MSEQKPKYSTNELAEKIVGKRQLTSNGRGYAVIFDQPCELGYRCPVCKNKVVIDGEYDERLEWSEYNGFLWCSVCNKDYPSALCQPDIDLAIKTYLETTFDACKRYSNEKNKELIQKVDVMSKEVLSAAPYYKLWEVADQKNKTLMQALKRINEAVNDKGVAANHDLIAYIVKEVMKTQK